MESIAQFITDHKIKGFLAEDEGQKLHELVLSVANLGPCLEVGSYCGKSTLFLASACKITDNTLYALDHHRGSEEHQLGELYHDAALYDPEVQRMDSFPAFRSTLSLAELESWVVPLVASSELVRKHWATPLAMVFIDGGHSEEMAKADCLGWASHIVSGGYLAVHDIFEFPEEGGQGPFVALQAVLATGEFELLKQVNSLGIVRKL